MVVSQGLLPPWLGISGSISLLIRPLFFAPSANQCSLHPREEIPDTKNLIQIHVFDES
eukprot:c141_g2_i1 orf=3-173(-)